MPLTRVEGDFSQVSNIVLVEIPEAPALQILIGWMSGDTFLVPADLSTAVQSGTVDTGLGWVNGYEVNDGGSILGAYGAYNEGVSVGASRSTNFSATWANGSSIYSQGPVRHNRVAFGAGVFVHAGTRNSGAPLTRSAFSEDFSVESFSWNVNSSGLQDGIGLDGCNGIDFVEGFFYAYGNTGTIGRSANGVDWEELTSGMPAPTFQQSSSLPYARFAGSAQVVVGIIGSQIIVSEDGGANWTDTYLDAFNDEMLVGGAGQNGPYMCGLAFGGGSWVAVGNVGVTPPGEGDGLVGTPRIRSSSVGAETPWTEVAVPVTTPPIDQMLDVVYDAAGSRFLALGRSTVSDTPLTGGTIVFEAQEIIGAGGSDKNGVLTFVMDNFIGAPTTAQISGTVISGLLAGYGDFGIASFSGSGNEWVIAMRVPADELRNDPENDYFSSIEIPGITDGVIPVSSAWDFNIEFVDADVTLQWKFSGLLLDRMAQGVEYTATFGPVDLPGEITGSIFHVLQSTDAGATFTAELQHPYDGFFDKDKGWIKLVPVDDGSNWLQQEDLFFILQEDGFNIIIEVTEETFFRVLEDGDLRLMEDVDSRLLEGAP